MQVTVEPRDNFTILHLRGEFDTFYCSLLQKEVDGLITSGVNRVALNMRLVKFINSTALGAIIKASKVLNAKGVDFGPDPMRVTVRRGRSQRRAPPRCFGDASVETRGGAGATSTGRRG